MGCCMSSGRGSATSVYPVTTGEASSQHINASSPRTSSVIHHTSRASHGRQRDSYVEPQSRSQTSGAPNSPLKDISPTRRSHTPHKAPWSFARLQKEREEYFDTRTSGRQEIWLVVRSVTEMLREGQTSEAQAILDAAGCTCPTGQIWKGVWDELGQYYSVPEWVVVQPEELVSQQAEDRTEREPRELLKDDTEFGNQEGKGGKGKEKAIAGEEVDIGGEKVKVRVRLSDRGSDVLVTLARDDKVSVLIRRVKEAAQLPPQTNVKIGYLGRVLHTTESLTAQGWNDSHIINALVFTTD